MRHDAPHPHSPRSGTQRPAQPRPNLADQLERLTPRFDELTHRAVSYTHLTLPTILRV